MALVTASQISFCFKRGGDDYDVTSTHSSSWNSDSSERWSRCTNAESTTAGSSGLSDAFPYPDGESDNDERFSVASDYDDEGSFHRSLDPTLFNSYVPSSHRTYICDALLYDCGCCWCELCSEEAKKKSEIKYVKNTFKEDVNGACYNALDSLRKPNDVIWESYGRVHRLSCPWYNYKNSNDGLSDVSKTSPTANLEDLIEDSAYNFPHPDLSKFPVSDYSKCSILDYFRKTHLQTSQFERKTPVERTNDERTFDCSNYYLQSDGSPRYLESTYLHYDQPANEPMARIDPDYTSYYQPDAQLTIHNDSAFSIRNQPDDVSGRYLDSTYKTYDRPGVDLTTNMDSAYSTHHQPGNESPMYVNFPSYLWIGTRSEAGTSDVSSDACKKSDEKNTPKSNKWQIYFNLDI